MGVHFKPTWAVPPGAIVQRAGAGQGSAAPPHHLCLSLGRQWPHLKQVLGIHIQARRGPFLSREGALPQQGGASWGREEHLVPAEVEEGQPHRQRVAAPPSGAGGAGGQSGPGQLPASPPEPRGEGLALPRPWSLSLPHSGSSHLALSESLLSLHPGAPRGVDTLSPPRRT